MAGIKLANGREVKELRVWDGVKWVAKRGRIFDGEKWIDFIRPPLSFKDDFITPTGMIRQTAKTIVRGNVEGLNLFSKSKVVNLAVKGTVASGTIISRSDYRGYYIPVKEGEKYSVSRDSLSNNRFDYGFTVEEPEEGVAISGGSTSYRDSLEINDIVVPSGYNYMFLYLSNQGDEIPNIKLIKETDKLQGDVILVQNSSLFNIGDEVTITDGVNSENVKVVGRNLVLNSNYLPMNGSDNGNHNLTLVKQDENGEDYFSAIPINNGNIYWNKGIRFSEPRYEGEIYTLSFDIMTTQNSNWGFYFYTNGAGNLIVRNIPSTNGKWERFTYTFIQEVTKDDSILFGFHQLIAGEEVGWRKLKLEKGNKATLWTPAPEDIYGTSDNVLSVTPITNEYKKNSIIARTNAEIRDNKLVYLTHKTYSVQ